MASLADKLHPFPERRSCVRHKVHSPAYTTKDENSSFILPHLNEIVDIGEGGMCFQNSSSLEPKANLKLCLDLSETQTHIEADGEVIWSSDSGRTGVRFQKISKESLQQLRQWLFINNIVACANHASSMPLANSDIDASSESLEYSAPLLPDHTSALTAVAAVDREVAAIGQDLDAALQLIADRALGLTRATGAAVALAGSENMICRASSGFDAPPVGAILQIGSGFSGECVRTGQLLYCEDSETDSRADKQSCKALGVRSMVAAPVRSDGVVVGILEVFSPSAHIFTDSDKDILQRLTKIVLQAIRRTALPAGSVEATSMKDISDAPPEDTEDSNESSRRARLLLALAAAVVATLLALIVIPRVRSKATGSQPRPVSAVSSQIAQPASAPEGSEALRHLAEQGDSTAQFAVGIRYATGDQVKQDYTEAARWFSLAAERGEIKAQSVLAAYYWDGTGVPKDLRKAYFWAILARASGDEASKARAAELATRISPSDRNAMQQEADDWLREHGFTTVSSSAQ